jgi:ferredoxin
MTITSVWIEEGCTLCGLCEDTCPEVFYLDEDSAQVYDDVDFEGLEDLIIEAAENCPVEVIEYEEDEDEDFDGDEE